MSARALIVLVAACGDNIIEQPTLPSVPMIESARFPANANPELDVLLLVDNSTSTFQYQLDFGAAVPTLFDVLGQLDALPELHVGVATSDLGTSGTTTSLNAPSIGTAGNGGCLENGGDDGRFQRGEGTGSLFMSGGTELATQIPDYVKVGAGGCGFEQHLGGVKRALENPFNAGFLRSGANLAIVIIGDEDDCSVRDPALFGGDDATLGPLASFRCTRFGLACNEDTNAIGVKTGCHSAPDSKYIEDVGTYVEFVGRLKADRRQILTAAIVGDPSPIDVESLPPAGGTGANQPTLIHSCAYTGDDGLVVADPALRDAQFVTSFGGPIESVCKKDLAPALANLGHAMKRLVGDPCLAGTSRDACTVTDEYADGTVVDIAACPADGDCFSFAADAKACPDSADHQRVSIRRLAPPPLGTSVVVHCE